MDITEEAFMNALQDACRAGIESEQARIIELLEDLQETFADPRYSTTGGFVEIFALKQGIALIKGKNK